MKITVCAGSTCVMVGAMTMLDQLEELREDMPSIDFEIQTVACLGYCKTDKKTCPVVILDGETILQASSQDVMERIMASVE